MPSLDSPQFSEYRFRAKSTRLATTAAVARVHPAGSGDDPEDRSNYERVEPLGSVSIYQPSDERHQANEQQQNLNRWEIPHETMTEPGGQQRWRGGNMDPQRSYVGWLAMAKVPGSTRLLQGLLGVAVAHHGTLPEADSILSEEGARISRGAARKYGVQGGTHNRAMEGSFDYDAQEREIHSRASAERAWEETNTRTYQGQTSGEYTASEAHGIAKEMDEKYRLGGPKKPEQTPIHPDQLKML